jgi:hypothetical protein
VFQDFLWFEKAAFSLPMSNILQIIYQPFDLESFIFQHLQRFAWKSARVKQVF